MASSMEKSIAKQQITKQVDKVRYTRNHSESRVLVHDNVITEQPLQINLHWQREDGKIESKVFAITMRSLGHDKFLILGLLYSEGVINSYADIESISPDSNSDNNSGNNDESSQNNNWHVQLINGIEPTLTSIERFQTTYSSCGLCGATSLKALELKTPPNLKALSENLSFITDDIYVLADTMRVKQTLFTLTGGVHGAALFNQQAQLLNIFEDIGRHNAVDKLIGQRLFEQQMPQHFPQQIPQQAQLLVMLVSGRVSFEIVQKAVMAGISILAAVGAPSDLAIKAAQRFDLTLIGFVKTQSFNVYCGDWRLAYKEKEKLKVIRNKL